ncbi:MAG: hypothetical protein SNJ73_08410 [Acetobacteraceae bacterium]
MPPHVKFILGHVLVGTVAGWALLAGVLALDIAGLRTLILGAADGPIALGMLALFFAITFGSAASGAAVMSLGRDGGDGGRRRMAPGAPVPARAAAVPRRPVATLRTGL